MDNGKECDCVTSYYFCTKYTHLHHCINCSMVRISLLCLLHKEHHVGWNNCPPDLISWKLPAHLQLLDNCPSPPNAIQQSLDEEDRVRWVESKDGVFSVKSLYRVMQPVSSAWFPSKIIWMSYAQPKISFFAWEASWGRVLTLDRMQKRGWALANRCFLCQKCGESIDHLLLHCERTREAWTLLLSSFGVSWVFPHSVKETLIGWRGSIMGKKRKVTWLLGPLCWFWVIWKAGNSIAFEDGVLSIQKDRKSVV